MLTEDVGCENEHKNTAICFNPYIYITIKQNGWQLKWEYD